MSKVTVKEEVIRWAVDRSGRTLGDLQNKFPKIIEWATGEERPSLRQLESLARATLTPFGYFFLDRPPDERLPIPFFRTSEDEYLNRPTANLIETIQIMQQRQAWLREYLIDQGQEPLDFVRSARVDQTPNIMANKIRQLLGIEETWASKQPTWKKALQNLREAIEAKGIMVIVNGVVGNNTHRKLEVAEFRGFVLVDEYAPLVFVNGTDGKAAQMFTLAHELAHILIGSSAAFDLRKLQPADNSTEKACDRIAAEFLVPETKFREIWPYARRSMDAFQLVAREFKVSELVVARRALDLHYITKNDFYNFYQAYIDKLDELDRKGAIKKEQGGDFYLTQNLRIGKPFARAIIRAVKEGKLLYNDAFHMTGLYGNAFNKYIESLGYGAS